MKVVFVLVDALKSLYLDKEYMPFLHCLASKAKYIKKIGAGPGFCERSEIFSGLDSFDNGFFTAIGYDKPHNEYLKIKPVVVLAKVMEKINHKYGHYAFVRIMSKIKKCCMKPYLIPLHRIYNYSLTEDGGFKYIQHEDLFDIISKNNLTYTTKLFTSLADKRPRLKGDIVDEITLSIKEETDFIPVYIGEIDAMGHCFGNDMASLTPYLKKTDEKLKYIFEICEKNDYAFVLLGDHGMVPVTKKVNIKKLMESTGLKHGTDYDMFLDSTIARFWTNNTEVLNEIKNKLHELDDIGLIVDESNYQKYRIPYDVLNSEKKRIYGDILWCANAGILISPDYFHSEKSDIRGMHGYLENTDESCFGQLISYHKNCKPEFLEYAPLSFVCEELSSILGIEKPNQNFQRKFV